jgi:hypothetical protein
MSVLSAISLQSVPMTSNGLSRSQASDVLARTAFEKPMEHLFAGAVLGQRDPCEDISAAVFVNKVAALGTGTVDIVPIQLPPPLSFDSAALLAPGDASSFQEKEKDKQKKMWQSNDLRARQHRMVPKKRPQSFYESYLPLLSKSTMMMSSSLASCSPYQVRPPLLRPCDRINTILPSEAKSTTLLRKPSLSSGLNLLSGESNDLLMNFLDGVVVGEKENKEASKPTELFMPQSKKRKIARQMEMSSRNTTSLL